jgi:dTMP kinase
MAFIVVEGVDGAGKSSVAAGLAALRRAAGRDVLSLREPGSTPVGERVRALLLDPAVGAVDPWTEALLFSACRTEMVRKIIRPALVAGREVILDRYYYSTLAYQGGGGGADVSALAALSKAATGGLEPDVVLLLDLAPEAAAMRRTRLQDRMEANDAAYYERVRRAYLALAAAPENERRFRVLDASGSPEAVLAAAAAAVASAAKESPRP